MILNWLDFFITDVVGGCINYLSTFYVWGTISLLHILIVATIAVTLLVTFVPRARSY